MDLELLLARLEAEGAAALSDEELAFVREGLASVVESVADPANPTVEDIAALASAATALDGIDAEQATRAAAVAERATEAADLIARIRATAETPEAEGDEAETAETETPAEGEADAPVVEGEADAPAEDEIVVPDDASEITDASVPVSAAAAPRRPALVDIARRRPARARPEPRRTTGTVITASADIPGVGAGQALNLDQLDSAILSRFNAVKNVPNSNGMRYPVARITTAFPEDRVLSETDAAFNQRQLDAVTAAGGPCAPLEVDYSIGVIGTAERPLRAALPQFNASRGGVRFQQPPVLGDFDAGVSAWTQANDVSATSGSPTKPCVRINCGNEVTAITEAIPVCGTIGNWIARNYDERVQAFRSLLGITAARFTESRHLNVIGAGSTQVSTGQILGATRDTLDALDRLIAAAQFRYRMGEGEQLDFLAPRWMQELFAADLAREQPGASTERLTVSDAQVNSFFAARNLNPTWLFDSETNTDFGTQHNGGALPWPSTAVVYLFPRGSWKHLDDGVLDLSVSGPYHDSVLNKTNDAQIWMESFENVYFQGTWSYRVEMDLCPDGSTSAAKTISICTSGS